MTITYFRSHDDNSPDELVHFDGPGPYTIGNQTQLEDGILTHSWVYARPELIAKYPDLFVWYIRSEQELEAFVNDRGDD